MLECGDDGLVATYNRFAMNWTRAASGLNDKYTCHLVTYDTTYLSPIPTTNPTIVTTSQACCEHEFFCYHLLPLQRRIYGLPFSSSALLIRPIIAIL